MTLKRCNELQTSRKAAVTRGLGVLSKNYILPHLKIVIDTLINKSVFTANHHARHYETRRYCCIALSDIVCNEYDIGIDDYSKYCTWSSEEQDIESETDGKKDDNDNDTDDDDDGNNYELVKLGLIDVTREDISSRC